MRLLIALVAALMLVAGAARAAEAPASAQTGGWLEQVLGQIETEIATDMAAAPAMSDALSREWRSFDRDGSPSAAVVDVALVAAVALLALLVETLVVRGLSQRPHRRARGRAGGPNLVDLLALLLCDIAGLAMFVVVFGMARRHWLAATGVSVMLATLAVNVLIRWRIAAVVIAAVLRPRQAVARLIEIPDGEALRLSRFLSGMILAIILLAGIGRVALLDEDNGAAHVISLVNAALICCLYLAIVVRARETTEALIRGRRTTGVLATLRAGLAQAWLPMAMILVAGLMVFFVAGLSLGVLGYYHAMVSTLGIWFLLLVLDRLTERVWNDADFETPGSRVAVGELQSRTMHHIVRAIGMAVAALLLAWVWIAAVEPSGAAQEQAWRSITAAIATLFIAFIAWELARLAIDRHLRGVGGGPNRPGADDDDDAAAPASRLQTILPLVRAAFAVVIGVLAALIVLSRLGVDTAPLIAGAGVLGLAVSFGSQSLVRDIISGLFYMWDDAFRVGEYIDTGRLKGTVETLGIRSVKLRHQNGPLHTIPYGQLGAVTNLSRDFATIKFNLRFAPDTDIELVRKTTKQIGLALPEEIPELAAEIMLPLKLQGMAEVVDNAIVLRFKFTARPVKPSWVQREYLKRMVKVFAEKGVQFASGATMILQASNPATSTAGRPSTSDPAETTAATVVGMMAASEAASLAASED